MKAGWVKVDEGQMNILVAEVDKNGRVVNGPFVIPKEGGEIGFETMREARKLLGSKF